MVARLLIANRGEIAIRIARAAAEIGVHSIAVNARDDTDALHLAKADNSAALKGSGVPAYLDMDDILDAAERAGADAIHPGYGFLSENAEFARRCTDRGITFVGPNPDLLESFGDKTRARELARAAGLPVLTGSDGAVTLTEADAFQRSLPAPGAVMLKAVAGGGGRGMRRVHHVDELAEAYSRCRSEALSAFGSAEVYVEELLPGPRHVEVQILGDGSGTVTQLGERDCSVQRRHQKLVEVTPGPGLSAELRAEVLAAAVRLGESVHYSGLGTVEFLISGDRFAFIEVNPRLQVEHTVTEEVTGVDLVRTQLALAGGSSLDSLGLTPDAAPRPTGSALQTRINLESMRADGTTAASSGTVTAFDLPSGRGVRVDASGYPGYRANPRYDALLAKLVIHDRSADFPALAARAYRALCESHVDGVETNIDVLAGIVAHPEFIAGRATTDFLDEHLAEILDGRDGHPRHYIRPPSAPDAPEARPTATVPEGMTGLRAETPGSVVSVGISAGDEVHAGDPLLVLEAMKMEHELAAPTTGAVHRVEVAAGDTVASEDLLVVLAPADVAPGAAEATAEIPPEHVRPDLAEVLERHAIGHDEQRAESVALRHRTGLRTARENLDDLCDPGSFVEYGPLAIASQRRRRSLEDLIERTPADGLVGGTATVNADQVGSERSGAVVMSYDYTVLAGTQGHANHRKKDRLFEVAERRQLPVVLFAEGGGGRPGDTDGNWVSMLDVPAFHLFGRLSALVPLVGIAAGRCFAGNAALLGCCDVVIAVEGANIGMGGPAMIEGGGLGVVTPEEVGPTSVQVPNGVVDVLVPDEAEAVRVAKQYLAYFQGPVDKWAAPDQRALRHVLPENRVRVYDVRRVIDGLADEDSVLELRAGFAPGMVTAFVRVEGEPMGLIANDPAHLGGAIDRDGADKAARFLQLCDAFGLPVVSLCDTPGFMVGTDSESQATVRHFSRLFVIGANLSVPIGLVVLRKSYGLGAQAMGGGSVKVPAFTVAWPTGEFGGMGLEGAVQLGYRKELEAITDPEERRALYERMVAESYERGKAVNTASVFEIDDVIDPADTRRWISSALTATPRAQRGHKTRPCVDTW
ncbi:acetyl-CoA carboxylase family protein [Parasphingorhabdus pacifica]